MPAVLSLRASRSHGWEQHRLPGCSARARAHGHSPRAVRHLHSRPRWDGCGGLRGGDTRLRGVRAERRRTLEPQNLRMVYLAVPGPGGGGGGGGLKKQVPAAEGGAKGTPVSQQPASLSVSRRPGRSLRVRSPRCRRSSPSGCRPCRRRWSTAPADDRDRAGVLEEAAPPTDSRGQGTGGGVGTGEGTGIGEGEGAALAMGRAAAPAAGRIGRGAVSHLRRCCVR